MRRHRQPASSWKMFGYHVFDGQACDIAYKSGRMELSLPLARRCMAHRWRTHAIQRSATVLCLPIALATFQSTDSRRPPWSLAKDRLACSQVDGGRGVRNACTVDQSTRLLFSRASVLNANNLYRLFSVVFGIDHQRSN